MYERDVSKDDWFQLKGSAHLLSSQQPAIRSKCAVVVNDPLCSRMLGFLSSRPSEYAETARLAKKLGIASRLQVESNRDVGNSSVSSHDANTSHPPRGIYHAKHTRG
jgi:hypothetical protein